MVGWCMLLFLEPGGRDRGKSNPYAFEAILVYRVSPRPVSEMISDKELLLGR